MTDRFRTTRRKLAPRRVRQQLSSVPFLSTVHKYCIRPVFLRPIKPDTIVLLYSSDYSLRITTEKTISIPVSVENYILFFFSERGDFILVKYYSPSYTYIEATYYYTSTY